MATEERSGPQYPRARDAKTKGYEWIILGTGDHPSLLLAKSVKNSARSSSETPIQAPESLTKESIASTGGTVAPNTG
jgi:hypothetical protein